MELLSTKLVKPFRVASAPILAATVSSGIVQIKDHDLLWGMLVSAIAVRWFAAPVLAEKGTYPEVKRRHRRTGGSHVLQF